MARIAQLAPETLLEIFKWTVLSWSEETIEERACEKVDRPTLRHISQVSTLWRDVAAPLHFRVMRLHPEQPHILSHVIATFKAYPNLSTYVHSLEIQPAWPYLPPSDGEPELDWGGRVVGYDWTSVLSWAGTLINLEHLYIRQQPPYISASTYSTLDLPASAFRRVISFSTHSTKHFDFHRWLIALIPNLKLLHITTKGQWYNDNHLLGTVRLHQYLFPTVCSTGLSEIFLVDLCMSQDGFDQLVRLSGPTLRSLECHRTYPCATDDLTLVIESAPLLTRVAWSQGSIIQNNRAT